MTWWLASSLVQRYTLSHSIQYLNRTIRPVVLVESVSSLYFATSMSATVNQAMEAAKRKTESLITETPGAVKAVAENPERATTDFLHHPATRMALPFVNGGLFLFRLSLQLLH